MKISDTFQPDTEAYARAKAEFALTHALVISLDPDVLVNCIAPGWITKQLEL